MYVLLTDNFSVTRCSDSAMCIYSGMYIAHFFLFSCSAVHGIVGIPQNPTMGNHLKNSVTDVHYILHRAARRLCKMSLTILRNGQIWSKRAPFPKLTAGTNRRRETAAVRVPNMVLGFCFCSSQRHTPLSLLVACFAHRVNSSTLNKMGGGVGPERNDMPHDPRGLRGFIFQMDFF